METYLIFTKNNEVSSKLAYVIMTIALASPVERVTALHLTLAILSLVCVILSDGKVKYVLNVAWSNASIWSEGPLPRQNVIPDST
jgi:hypothetical protein